MCVCQQLVGVLSGLRRARAREQHRRLRLVVWVVPCEPRDRVVYIATNFALVALGKGVRAWAAATVRRCVLVGCRDTSSVKVGLGVPVRQTSCLCVRLRSKDRLRVCGCRLRERHTCVCVWVWGSWVTKQDRLRVCGCGLGKTDLTSVGVGQERQTRCLCVGILVSHARGVCIVLVSWDLNKGYGFGTVE